MVSVDLFGVRGGRRRVNGACLGVMFSSVGGVDYKPPECEVVWGH